MIGFDIGPDLLAELIEERLLEFRLDAVEVHGPEVRWLGLFGQIFLFDKWIDLPLG
ncbi:MAG: hypothetical protein ACREXS_09360 [Gammaproteobacteria bacterium]